ncbi:MAG: acetyl-CoA carboxylase biotin carboxyl carrier protein subunit, partial [Bacteroidetes bacterium]|nr:acetyl-CoA carboxylase biotin carboxyl carrier protein subunit [Candidatus Cryptobacteroides excrementavium]
MKQYNFKINGNEYNVTINSVDGNVADVTVVANYKVELGSGSAPISVQPAQTAAPAVQSAPAAAPAAPAPAP